MGLISGSLRQWLIALAVTLTATASLTVLGPQPAGAQERPMLRLGSTGDAVLVLEQRLTELGYQLDTPDTTFGPDTRTAVITLQTTANIDRDGIVGPITWAALDQGIPYQGNTPPPTPPPLIHISHPTNPS